MASEHRPDEDVLSGSEAGDQAIRHPLPPAADEAEIVNGPRHIYPSKRLVSKSGQALACVVCKTNPSKYKFKCCLFGYCSAACFKNHGVCAQPRSAQPAPAAKRRFVDPFADLDMPPEDIVPKEKLEKLRTDPEVLRFLEHPKLRRLIQRVDAARDRHASLEALMQSDANFVKVAHAIARVIDAPLQQ